MTETNIGQTTYQPNDDLFNKKINTVPSKQKEIGIDTDDSILRAINELSDDGTSTSVNLSDIDAFSQISKDRDSVYETIDTMSEDPTIAAALEIYTEDATQINSEGRVLWATSDDDEVRATITNILDTMNIEKNIYSWTYSLIKYGDLYLKLYHESDYEDGLFDKKDDGKNSLNENVVFRAYPKSDKLVHYIEAIPNPAEMFELTRFGKSYAYIQAPTNLNLYKQKNELGTTSYFTHRYAFNKKDVVVYAPTEFVHASLDEDSSRYPEEVEIFTNHGAETDKPLAKYRVKRGQSILYNTFRIWRQTNLLENALLLNRITRSSLLRLVEVEVADMGKDDVKKKLHSVKQLFEQKAALNVGKAMSEYLNPGPMENTIYSPSRNGVGTISIQDITADANVTGLDDVNLFKTKLYSSLRIPKAYLGDLDDAAGFNGGSSLSIVSSRYAKTVKRIQACLIQAITDAINIMLLDKGLDSYVNKFTLKMQEPVTQEELDKRDARSSEIQIASDVMNLVSDIPNDATRLKILKSLLSEVITNQDVLSMIGDEAEKLKSDETDVTDSEDISDDEDFNLPSGSFSKSSTSNNFSLDNTVETSNETEEPTNTKNRLPSPEELNAGDFTDNNTEF